MPLVNSNGEPADVAAVREEMVRLLDVVTPHLVEPLTLTAGYALADDLEIIAGELVARAKRIEDLTRERDEARQICEDNVIGWMADRCAECGHRFAGMASHCPQCAVRVPAPWNEPEEYPDLCTCKRCAAVRSASAETDRGYVEQLAARDFKRFLDARFANSAGLSLNDMSQAVLLADFAKWVADQDDPAEEGDR